MVSTKEEKIARQERYQEPGLLQSLRYSFLRLSSNRANRTKAGKFIEIGNACIGNLTRGTMLIGDTSEQVWQTIESCLSSKDGITDSHRDYYKDLVDLDIGNLSCYFLNRKVLIVRDIEALSIKELRLLLALMVRGRVAGIQIFIGIADIYLDTDSIHKRMIKEIFTNCMNRIVFNSDPTTAQYLSDVFGHHRIDRPFIDYDQISSLPDNYFWFSSDLSLTKPTSPVLCQL